MKLIRSIIDLDSRVQVMGVLNVTPDSFSDGGQFRDVEKAVERALEIEAEGADILDIGGESTRPGSKPVSAAEELERILPVLEAVRGRLSIPVSIDTTKSQVARAAIDAGAEIINDISGLRFNPELAEIAADTGAAIVLMHSRGTPETMQGLPPVEDIFEEVNGVLRGAYEQALQCGVDRQKIIIDPGIGFGKTAAQNLQLINGLHRIKSELGLPLLLGSSRKSFIKRTLDQFETGRVRVIQPIQSDRRQLLGGTAASVAIGVLRGANLVRVHDIVETVAVVKLVEAMISI